MQCASLSELPTPPAGKTGWPWTEQSPPLLKSDEATNWARVSVVTPSYNQAEFIEETIRSVLLQGYPDLEYIVIDGGSTDNSVEIIRKYERWLTYWVSEPDRGQTDAINKGLRRASGDICAWLNSDDVYLRKALERAARCLAENPKGALAHGGIVHVDQESRVRGFVQISSSSLRELLRSNFISQPATFMRRDALLRAGYLNERYHFCMDYELWLRLALQGELVYVDHRLAAFRYHAQSKTCTQLVRMKVEVATAAARFLDGTNVPLELRNDRERLLANSFWEAGLMLWFNGGLEEGRKYIHGALKGTPTFSEEMAFGIASAAVLGAGLDAEPKIGELLESFPTMKPLRWMALGWACVLLVREHPQEPQMFTRLLRGLWYAPTTRVFRAASSLIMTMTLGAKTQRYLLKIKRSFTHSTVGLPLSELS